MISLRNTVHPNASIHCAMCPAEKLSEFLDLDLISLTVETKLTYDFFYFNTRYGWLDQKKNNLISALHCETALNF